MLGTVAFSAATALDGVRAGRPLQSIADEHSLDEVVRAVRDAKTALRLGIGALDEAGLHRIAGIEPWSIAMVVGHALDMDAAAHRITRALRNETMPEAGIVAYDLAGAAGATKEELLGRIAEAEARLAALGALPAAGARFVHRDLGELDARGWLLFIAVHDALHLHQAAAIVRTPR